MDQIRLQAGDCLMLSLRVNFKPWHRLLKFEPVAMTAEVRVVEVDGASVLLQIPGGLSQRFTRSAVSNC